MLDDVVVVAYGTAKKSSLQDQRLLLVEKNSKNAGFFSI